MDKPITSARAIERFTPHGSPRTYLLAPLSYFQRIDYEADVTRIAGLYPSDAQLMVAARAAILDAAPANAEELMQIVAAREEAPADAQALSRFGQIELQLIKAPVYVELLVARQKRLAKLPWVAAMHALRGWEGPGLPPFEAVDGVASPACMEALAALEELPAVGWQAHALMKPGRRAEGNSASPSPSPGTPAPAKAGTSRKAAGAGSSRGKSSRKTRASA
ncbi:hypothetical protein KTR66_04680 [Roseococcus sp. SDR]|uniref:hypothetical protein n=1 Tax=Roseococcus sp. SDR TaxID=2835532 RepID=UPI001BCBCC48|nr:hypothetical protein [Roseococcus sp. SDR]MBS7789275.1 hypothetical protein [Roseococcus sp. SDR]MBV1844589.1 hypothetical protein [Roseococcus sp. SDR]